MKVEMLRVRHTPMPEMIPEPANVFTPDWNLGVDAPTDSIGPAIAA